MRVEKTVEGVTEGDLTPEFIQASASAMLDEMESKIPNFKATPSTSMIEKDGKKLGVIRLNVDGAIPWISVIGIVGKKIIRVTCANPDASGVDVRSRECAEALRADFGTELDG